jgi:hypothetical protein
MPGTNVPHHCPTLPQTSKPTLLRCCVVTTQRSHQQKCGSVLVWYTTCACFLAIQPAKHRRKQGLKCRALTSRCNASWPCTARGALALLETSRVGLHRCCTGMTQCHPMGRRCDLKARAACHFLLCQACFCFLCWLLLLSGKDWAGGALLARAYRSTDKCCLQDVLFETSQP